MFYFMKFNLICLLAAARSYILTILLWFFPFVVLQFILCQIFHMFVDIFMILPCPLNEIVEELLERNQLANQTDNSRHLL